MAKRTPLFETHTREGARIVEFGGWEMPLHYGSQIAEHHAVRHDAGMFDVSHMARVDLRGPDARAFLSRLLANDVAKLTSAGQALYGCMLNDTGGVIDDLIVYLVDDAGFRLVVNAATRDKDLDWIERQASGAGKVRIELRADLAMIAVQGPQARAKTYAALGEEVERAARPLGRFRSVQVGDYYVARTGYTGEDGFEIMLPDELASTAWQALRDAGVRPCGLGARDTLRLEAGMSLYGSELDDHTSPLESGLGWTVAWDPSGREFLGRAALERQRAAGITRKMVGLVLEGRGVLRAHQTLLCSGVGAGEVTSGTFSPTLSRSIGLARVPVAVKRGSACQVEIRGQAQDARVVKYPFVRAGKSCLDAD